MKQMLGIFQYSPAMTEILQTIIDGTWTSFRYTEILALTKPRERADITFGEDELQIHVHTPVNGLFDEKKEPEAPAAAEPERKDDPFSDTDLPVNVQ